MRPRTALILTVVVVLATAPLWTLLLGEPARPRASDGDVAALALAREQSAVIDTLRTRLAGYQREAAAARAARAASAPEQAAAPAAAAAAAPGAASIVFAHAINPMPAGHGLHADVLVTFASLARAASYARARGVEVRLFTAEFADEARLPRPPIFEPLANLTRHAHAAYDMGSRGIAERRLPMVGDIFERAYDATAGWEAGGDASCGAGRRTGRRRRVYLGYTNADIGVQEDFYVRAAEYAAKSDAFVINRVEVPEAGPSGAPYGAGDLEEIYEAGRKNAQKHPGYDCFFWRRDGTNALRLFNRGVFLGYPPIGKALAEGLRCAFGSRYRELRGKHHTFHLGDRNGGWTTLTEYEHFNRKAAKRSQADFARLGGVSCRSAQAAIDGAGDAGCAIDGELAARPFARWDRPGTSWPPEPVPPSRPLA